MHRWPKRYNFTTFIHIFAQSLLLFIHNISAESPSVILRIRKWRRRQGICSKSSKDTGLREDSHPLARFSLRFHRTELLLSLCCAMKELVQFNLANTSRKLGLRVSKLGRLYELLLQAWSLDSCISHLIPFLCRLEQDTFINQHEPVIQLTLESPLFHRLMKFCSKKEPQKVSLLSLQS